MVATLSYPTSRDYAPSSQFAAATVMCLAYIMQPGTGGLSNIDYLKARGEIGYPLVRSEYRPEPLAERAILAEGPARTSAEDLEHIRAFLRPAMADLANMLGVSRQALYDWQSGKPVTAENAVRLASLAGAADVLAKEGLSASAQLVRRPIQSGKTLLDIVREGGDAGDAARMLAALLRREAGQRSRLSARLSSRPRRTAAGEDLGTPMLDEVASATL